MVDKLPVVLCSVKKEDQTLLFRWHNTDSRLLLKVRYIQQYIPACGFLPPNSPDCLGSVLKVCWHFSRQRSLHTAGGRQTLLPYGSFSIQQECRFVPDFVSGHMYHPPPVGLWWQQQQSVAERQLWPYLFLQSVTPAT